jgi:uncharacterized protein (TIGR00255 family)
MLRSMTGYGRAQSVIEGKKITVEIRSVNHRYSDYNIKVPRAYGFLEDKTREYMSKCITRGKVDIYITIESCGQTDKNIILDEALAEEYVTALYMLRDKFNLADDISVSTIAGFRDIFAAEQKEDNPETVWSMTENVLREAADMFIQMRSHEGARIEKDLSDRIKYMSTLVEKVDMFSPETVKAYERRLYEKIKETLGDRSIDDARILTEAALFADKVSVNEETVRLHGHFDEFESIMKSGEPAGRKMDFLIQEMNREVNTIGSKANDLEIARIVVELKGEIEKLREQIQNIE